MSIFSSHSQVALEHLKELKPRDGWKMEYSPSADGNVRLLRRNVPLTDHFFMDIHYDGVSGCVVGILSMATPCTAQVLVNRQGLVTVDARELTTVRGYVAGEKGASSTTLPIKGKRRSSIADIPTTVTGQRENVKFTMKDPLSEPSTQHERAKIVLGFLLLLFGLRLILGLLMGIAFFAYLLILPAGYLYLCQSCPPSSTFDAKKELKRVLRGHYLPTNHPAKPTSLLEQWTARITASITTELATLPGYTVDRWELGKAATIVRLQVPSANVQGYWGYYGISCSKSWSTATSPSCHDDDGEQHGGSVHRRRTRSASAEHHQRTPAWALDEYQVPISQQQEQEKPASSSLPSSTNNNDGPSLSDWLASTTLQWLQAAGGFTLSTTGKLAAPPIQFVQHFVLPGVIGLLVNLYTEYTSPRFQDWISVVVQAVRQLILVIRETPKGKELQRQLVDWFRAIRTLLSSRSCQQVVVDGVATSIKVAQALNTPESKLALEQATLLATRIGDTLASPSAKTVLWESSEAMWSIVELWANPATSAAVAECLATLAQALEQEKMQIKRQQGESSRPHPAGIGRVLVGDVHASVEEVLLSSLGGTNPPIHSPNNVSSDDDVTLSSSAGLRIESQSLPMALEGEEGTAASSIGARSEPYLWGNDPSSPRRQKPHHPTAHDDPYPPSEWLDLEFPAEKFKSKSKNKIKSRFLPLKKDASSNTKTPPTKNTKKQPRIIFDKQGFQQALEQQQSQDCRRQALSRSKTPTLSNLSSQRLPKTIQTTGFVQGISNVSSTGDNNGADLEDLDRLVDDAQAGGETTEQTSRRVSTHARPSLSARGNKVAMSETAASLVEYFYRVLDEASPPVSERERPFSLPLWNEAVDSSNERRPRVVNKERTRMATKSARSTPSPQVQLEREWQKIWAEHKSVIIFGGIVLLTLVALWTFLALYGLYHIAGMGSSTALPAKHPPLAGEEIVVRILHAYDDNVRTNEKNLPLSSENIYGDNVANCIARGISSKGATISGE